MKKMTTWSLALASLLIAAASCSEHKAAPATTGPAPTATTAAPATSPTVATAYTCSMHPAVVSDHPGKCPKCGMDLIVKK